MVTPATNPAPAQASVEAACDRVWKAAITALPEKAWAALNDLAPPELSAIFDTLACAALSPPPTVGAEDEAVAWAEVYSGRVASVTLKPGRFNTVPLFAHPAPAADGQRVKDGRPEGWTEALAISFMAANGHNPEMGMFAKSFNEGAWREIKDEWPEFVEFASARIRACLATEEGADV